MAIHQLETKSEVAEILKVSENNLNYFLYGMPKQGKQYHTYSIPKKNGGLRLIEAPNYGLKRAQRALSDFLYDSIQLKSCVYAFCRDKEKGIRGNASKHKKRKWVITIDLKDFFQSIHFGRVRGLFLSEPFNYNPTVATILAQVACYNGHLAMGAPSSPVISNLICRRLDNQLIDFAINNKLTYSRYADDITFSTNMSRIPEALGFFEDGHFHLGTGIREIIENCNGFVINGEKVHFAGRINKQCVTGLVVNEKVNVDRHYVRQVRAMLYAWKKFGKEAAAVEHFKKYKLVNTDSPALRFGEEIKGRINYIGYIKGRSDSVYASLCGQLWELEPKAPLKVRYNPKKYDAAVYCEGASDPIHLKAALSFFQSRGQYTDLRIYWVLYNKEQQAHIGNAMLKEKLMYQKRWKESENVEIFLFDRDDPRYYDMEDEKGLPKYYEHGLYSMMLPVVPHRSSNKVCIEHYYENADLLKKDSYGRRIFLSTEFDKTTAYCEKDRVTTGNKKALLSDYEYIIADDVTDQNGKSVALSKMDFAKNIEQQKPPFDVMDFSHFSLIFDRIKSILFNRYQQQMSQG